MAVNPLYEALIDWRGDDFTTAGENVTGRVFGQPGVVIRRGRDQIRSLAPPAAGSCDFELDNASGDYSPENSAGPLNGYLRPGPTVKIRASGDATNYRDATVNYRDPVKPYAGLNAELFTGVLDDLAQHPEIGQQTVSAPALGVLSKLAGRQVSTALYQNIRTDLALIAILDAVGVPVGDRVFSAGQTVLDWWWLDEEDALQAALALLYSEGPGASLYENGRGQFVFEDRNYRLTTPRSSVAQATFHSEGPEPVLAPPIGYNPRLQDIINSAVVDQQTRAPAGALAVVWTLGANVVLAPNETRALSARTAAGDPFIEAVAPVAGTDYTVSAGGLSAISLNRTSGANLTITLTGGAAGATVTGLQLRAKPVPVTSRTRVTNTVDAAQSIARYGRRAYTLPIRPEMQVNVLQDLVNVIVSAYKEPRPIVELRVVGGTTERLAQIFRRELSDRITVIDSLSKFGGDVFIERIEHRMTYGRRHECIFGCERASGLGYAVWGTAVWDTHLWGF